MPVLTGPITPDGALVEVELGVSRATARTMRAALMAVPPPQTFRAIIDTGAEITCIDSRLVVTLGLIVANFNLANVPSLGGLAFTGQYDISLTILHPSGQATMHLTLPNLDAEDLRLNAPAYDVLLGRDVLARCQFHYDGAAGTFQLAY